MGVESRLLLSTVSSPEHVGFPFVDAWALTPTLVPRESSRKESSASWGLVTKAPELRDDRESQEAWT